jgi:hypothetical protein
VVSILKMSTKNLSVLFLLSFIFLFSFCYGQQNISKEEAIEAYKNEFLNSFLVDYKWNGSRFLCKSGHLDELDIHKAERRINYFRKMAGLNDIKLIKNLNDKAQSAAFLMHVNKTLSHYPDKSWKCYFLEGAEAAQKSILGRYGNFPTDKNGIDIVSLFIEDWGIDNYPCGHRRWLLYSRSREMGFGSTGKTEAIYIGDKFPQADTINLPVFFSYPPQGFIPTPIVYERWSFSIPDIHNVKFDGVEVRATDYEGNSLKLKKLKVKYDYGDPTIVWEIKSLFKKMNGVYRVIDMYTEKPIKININNVLVDGIKKSYSYEVTMIKVD